MLLSMLMRHEQFDDDCREQVRLQHEVNVLIGDVSPDDIRLFFGDEADDFLVCPEGFRLPQLLKLIGVFKSTGQARKNGWDRGIDEGWTCFKIGKFNIEVCILKVTR